jgi:hypothetical protein
MCPRRYYTYMYIHVKIYHEFEGGPTLPSRDGGVPKPMEGLLLQQAGVAGDALPAAVAIDPGIGEAAEMFVGLALVGAFGVVNTDDHGGVAIHADFEVLDGQYIGSELRVFDIGEELGFVADLAIVFGIDEFAAEHGVEGAGVATYLSFIPQVFHDNQLGFLRIVFGLLGSGRHGRNQGQQKTAACGTKHGLARPLIPT